MRKAIIVISIISILCTACTSMESLATSNPLLSYKMKIEENKDSFEASVNINLNNKTQDSKKENNIIVEVKKEEKADKEREERLLEEIKKEERKQKKIEEMRKNREESQLRIPGGSVILNGEKVSLAYFGNEEIKNEQLENAKKERIEKERQRILEEQRIQREREEAEKRERKAREAEERRLKVQREEAERVRRIEDSFRYPERNKGTSIRGVGKIMHTFPDGETTIKLEGHIFWFNVKDYPPGVNLEWGDEVYFTGIMSHDQSGSCTPRLTNAHWILK